MPADVKSEVKRRDRRPQEGLEGNDTETIKTASEHAATVSQKMGTAIYAAAQAERQAAGAAESTSSDAPQEESVVEAEIVDEGEGGAA